MNEILNDLIPEYKRLIIFCSDRHESAKSTPEYRQARERLKELELNLSSVEIINATREAFAPEYILKRP